MAVPNTLAALQPGAHSLELLDENFAYLDARIGGNPMLKTDYDTNADGKVDLAAGGTGASTAADARTNLGLGSAAVLDATAFGASLIDDADASAARTTLDAAQSTWTQPVSGAVERTVHEKLGDLLTAEDLGIVGDGVVEEKVISISSGSPVLTVTGGAFTADDVGKLILVYGAGTAGAPLASTISVYTSATQITLANNAATTVTATSKQIAYGTDDAAAINAAMSAQVGPIRFNPGVYIVSSEVAINDHSGIVGTSAHWKRRKVQHRYDKDASTVFKYIGAGGSNTCVVRASNMAVGVEIATPNDDLLNYALRDFHVDASNIAEFGLYSYRAGNCASQGNITAECAKVANIVHIGQYAAEFGAFGAYESENMGVACGIDLFSWGSVENTNFAFKAYYHTCNNGTAANFVEGSGITQAESQP